VNIYEVIRGRKGYNAPTIIVTDSHRLTLLEAASVLGLRRKTLQKRIERGIPLARPM